MTHKARIIIAIFVMVAATAVTIDRTGPFSISKGAKREHPVDLSTENQKPTNQSRPTDEADVDSTQSINPSTGNVVTLTSSSVSQETRKAALKQIVSRGAALITASAHEFQLIDDTIARVAPHLDMHELNELAEISLSQASTQDERLIALYILSKAGQGSIPALTHIASAPITEESGPLGPHTSEAQLKKFELSLRLSAIEAIDELASSTPHVAQKAIEEIVSKTNHASVQLLAQLALSESQNLSASGTPQSKFKSLVSQLIDAKGI
jgi:hypothetical protein